MKIERYEFHFNEYIIFKLFEDHLKRSIVHCVAMVTSMSMVARCTVLKVEGIAWCSFSVLEGWMELWNCDEKNKERLQ